MAFVRLLKPNPPSLCVAEVARGVSLGDGRLRDSGGDASDRVAHVALGTLSRQYLQRLLQHLLGSVHRRSIELVGAHRAHQVGHFLNGIDRGVSDVAFGCSRPDVRVRSA